jgi:hypothetical protein
VRDFTGLTYTLRMASYAIIIFSVSYFSGLIWYLVSEIDMHYQGLIPYTFEDDPHDYPNFIN